jgi:putative colanic acid biosynthesis acetyltransferase WcaF
MRLDTYNNSSFDRGASSLKEALWWSVRSLLFAPWFPVPSILKVVALRLFGATVGRGVVIRSRVNVTFPWRLTVGDHVWIGEEVLIQTLAPVTIGSHVCISQRAFLCTGSHDHASEGFDLLTAPISVEDGVWIAAGAFIAPGVTIARGGLCCAGAVVLKNTAPGIRVGGNPARELPDPRHP